MNWKKLKIGFVLSIFVMAIVVGTNAGAMSLFGNSGGADLGDMFVLDKLFDDSQNNRILKSGGTDLGDLFILSQLFAEEIAPEPEVVAVVVPVAVPDPLADKLAGRILIQVEEKGAAWYVNPVTKKRVALGNPSEAYAAMSSVSLGISNADFDDISTAGVPDRLKGRILIKPQDDGKMYYINPVNSEIIAVMNVVDAQMLIEDTGLGISNADIAKIAVAN